MGGKIIKDASKEKKIIKKRISDAQEKIDRMVSKLMLILIKKLKLDPKLVPEFSRLPREIPDGEEGERLIQEYKRKFDEKNPGKFRIEKFIDKIADTGIKPFIKKTEKKFNRIKEKLEKKLKQKEDALKGKVKNIENKVDKIKEKIEKEKQRIDELKTIVEVIQTVQDIAKELNTSEASQSKLSQLKEKIPIK